MSSIEQHTHLYMIRHGQTESNVAGLLHGATDVPLNPYGLRQAEQVALRIQEMTDLNVMYSSPLQRALQTAQAISRLIELPLHLHPGLAEINFGLVEGSTFAQLAESHPELHQRMLDQDEMDLGWPGGESRREFGLRIEAALDEIINAHRGKRLIVVAHGGVIGRATSMLLGNNPGDWESHAIGNCSVTHFEIAASGPIAHLIGDTVHLEGFDLETAAAGDAE
ncbi:alpha-ribazole phosphatase [soil metagenome]|jgi:broad specificity phosphatase PhoE